MILGIDAISLGHGTIDFTRHTFHSFGKDWPLLGEKVSQVIGTIDSSLHMTHPKINILISKFRHIFSSNTTPLASCNLQPIKIQTVGDPISQRPYRTPLLKLKAISKPVDDMLAQGIIQPSCSPWASPVTLFLNRMAPLGSVWTTGS